MDYEIDPSALGGQQVLGATIVSAISPGTELAAYRGAPPLRPNTGFPRLVGYCNVARVLRVGDQVTLVRPGDRILTFASHRTHVLVDQGEILATLSADLAADDAVVAYLYHLGYNAVLRADVRLGTTVVVIGLGVVGLCTVALAAMAGATVLAVSEHAPASATASRFGAQQCFSRAQVPQMLERLGPARAQAVISTSSTWADWDIALDAAGEQASIAVLGFPGREEGSIPFNPFDSARFYARQLRIIAAGVSPGRPDDRGFLPFNERENLARLLQWIRAGRLMPQALVSGRFDGHEIAMAYTSLLARAASPITYLLTWSADDTR